MAKIKAEIYWYSYFFSLGKATEGPAGATRGGLGTRHRGAVPQRAGARARTRTGALPTGSRTNGATLGNLPKSDKKMAQAETGQIGKPGARKGIQTQS